MTETPASTDQGGKPAPDAEFFLRADAHIALSNKQLANAPRGEVSASMMFAAARYSAWLSAVGYASRPLYIEKREQTIEYLVGQFRMMLEDNVDDYITNYEGLLAAAQERADAP